MAEQSGSMRGNIPPEVAREALVRAIQVLSPDAQKGTSDSHPEIPAGTRIKLTDGSSSAKTARPRVTKAKIVSVSLGQPDASSPQKTKTRS